MVVVKPSRRYFYCEAFKLSLDLLPFLCILPSGICIYFTSMILGTNNNKKAPRGPTFKLGSVVVNVQSILKAEGELEHLVKAIPTSKSERRKWKIDFHTKFVHWDCPWDVDEDSSLLKGIYEYGMGNWESIKMDSELHLYDKVCS